jgi:hypothetical protein
VEDSVNQATRSIAPALAAGNAVVLKESEWTSAATPELEPPSLSVGMRARNLEGGRG